MPTSMTDDNRVILDAPVGQMPRVWVIVAFISLSIGFVLTFEASFDNPSASLITLLPLFLLPVMAVAFIQLPARGPSKSLLVATAASVAGWSILVFDDDRWSVLTFALYGLCFSLGRRIGIAFAGIVTGIWTLAWLEADAPDWRLLIPVAAYGAGLLLWVTLQRADAENAALADLVEQLRASRHDLAVSEREKGALKERARFAGEIHDTLAQGFTSIVVLSRAAQRTGDGEDALRAIETTAVENLQAARRLVAAIGPAELDASSLPDALERQLALAIDDSTDANFDVTGDPVPLAGAVEVALLRGLQEALLNVRTHASAGQVHVTLSYLDDAVALDVRDDGIGFAPGVIADRGPLTGGQGLAALRHRAETLGGRLTVESAPASGSVISMQLPVTTA